MSAKQKRFVLLFTVLFILLTTHGLQFAKLVLKDPPYVYKVQGDRFRRLGLLNEALNEYDKAVSIKRDYAECYYWNAVIYNKKRLFSQALFNINSALKHKDKFHSKTMMFDTLFLKTEVYFAVYKDVIMKQKDLKIREKYLNIIDKPLDEIIETIRGLRANLGKEFKSYLQYQSGKAFFYKAKHQFLSKINLDESLRLFEEAKKAKYKIDFVFYYKYRIYKNKYQQSKSMSDQKKAIEYRKLAQDALAESLKYNPNILLDFKRQELD